MIRVIYYPYVFFALFVFLFIGDAKAFTCRTSAGVVIPPGGSTTPVDIMVNIGPILSNKNNEVVDIGQIVCANTIPNSNWNPKVVDTLKTDNNPLTLNSSIFRGISNGMVINGVSYNSPVKENINVISLSNGQSKGVGLRVFINLSSSPTADIVVRKGDVIGQINFYQVNDQNGCPQCGPYRWRLIANNDAYFVTTGCTINAARQINIEFGPMSADSFTQNISDSWVKKEQNLDYKCADTQATQDILVRLIGNASSFSPDIIRTTNANLGIAMMHNNVVVRPGETFRSHITNGIGNDIVTFIPVKSNIPADKIATGHFSGSATLIFSAP